MSARPSILLVDDDPEVVFTTERILSKAGYDVSTAGTAAEAAALLRSRPSDLVLLDVVLPDGDGVDLARALKSDPALAGTFVVLLSGARTHPDEQADGLRRGHADGFLVRPIGRAELLARVEAFVRLRAVQEALRASERSVKARLEALLSPEADVSSLTLTDILDTGEVRLLLEDFRALTGFGVALLDGDGRTVAASSPDDLCRRRATVGPSGVPGSHPDAPACDQAKCCPVGSHTCRLGLRNVEAPVAVVGRRFGTLFVGPFLYDDDPPAAPFLSGPPGTADPSLVSSLARVPRFRRERVGAASDFLVRLAGMLSTLSHGRVVLSRTVAERDRLVADLTSREAEIRELYADLERRVAERTAELRASNAELQSFAYTIAHDLTAPLRGISGHAGAILEDHSGSLDADARRRLARISEAAHRGGRLIEALLRLAAISRAVVVRRPVDLGALASSIADDLAEEEPDRAVAWRIAPDLTAHSDELLVRELLENLLRNAWKFTSKNAAARIEVGATDANGETIFHVRDDGAGFDMAHASSLFGAFHRAHPPGAYPGLGIGLAISEKIVRRHGGRIRAWGRPGGGATFTFTLAPPEGVAPETEGEATDG